MTVGDYKRFFATPYYEYWGNVEKKRAYSKFMGIWKDPDIIPTFLEDTNKVIELMPLGVETSIADVSNLGIGHHEKCKEAHRELHRICLLYLKKLALLIAVHHNHGDIFYVAPLHEQTGLKVDAYFYSFKTADAYLDKWQEEMDKENEIFLGETVL